MNCSFIPGRHTADLVISFGIRAFLPMTVVGGIGLLVQKWAATAIPLANLIGQTITAEYVTAYHPVFSCRDFGHFTLVVPSNLVIGGRRISCVNGCADKPSTSSSKVTNRSKKWRVVCPKCNYRTSFKDPADLNIEEGDKDKVFKIPGQPYLRAPYPLERKCLSWVPQNTTTPAPATVTGGLAQQPGASQPPPQASTVVRSHYPRKSKRSREPSPSKSSSTHSTPEVPGEGSSGKRTKRSGGE